MRASSTSMHCWIAVVGRDKGSGQAQPDKHDCVEEHAQLATCRAQTVVEHKQSEGLPHSTNFCWHGCTLLALTAAAAEGFAGMPCTTGTLTCRVVGVALWSLVHGRVQGLYRQAATHY